MMLAVGDSNQKFTLPPSEQEVEKAGVGFAVEDSRMRRMKALGDKKSPLTLDKLPIPETMYKLGGGTTME